MGNDFFDISGDTIKAAEAAAEFRMVEPDTVKRDKKGARSWTEHGTIESAHSRYLEAVVEGKKCSVMLLEVQFRIDGLGSGKNVGFYPVRFKSRINKDSIGSGKDPTSPMGKQATMSRISIARLRGLLKIVGIEPDLEDGGYSQTLLVDIFPPLNSFSAEPSPLLGTKLWIEVKQGESESDDKTRKYINIEVNRVISGDE